MDNTKSTDPRIQLAQEEIEGGYIYQTESSYHEQKPGLPPARHIQPNYPAETWANTRDTSRWSKPKVDGSKHRTFHKDMLQSKLSSYNIYLRCEDNTIYAPYYIQPFYKQ